MCNLYNNFYNLYVSYIFHSLEIINFVITILTLVLLGFAFYLKKKYQSSLIHFLCKIDGFNLFLNSYN